MWRITIIANAIMMGLFWVLSLLSTSLAYNRFAQYPENGAVGVLPLPTELALSIQLWIGILPLSWIILSYVIWQKVKNKQSESRLEYLLAFTTITIVTGLSMLTFFTLAGILPFLYIGTPIK